MDSEQLRIVGLTGEESLALANELAGYIKRPEIVYEHAWQAGDLAVWDNLALQHARDDLSGCKIAITITSRRFRSQASVVAKGALQ